MKPMNAFATAAVVSFFVSGGVVYLLSNSDGDEVAARPPLERDSSEELGELRTAVAELTRKVDSLSSQMSTPAPSGDSRVSLNEVERLVDQVLAARGVAPEATLVDAEDESAELDITGLANELLADGLSEQQRVELWQKAKAAGKEDELLAWFQDRAKENPNDADIQVELASAYFQKLNGMTDGPMKGQVAVLADQALDRALELDDHHWEARFSKAVALSFWPPVFGKQQEAINQFETLLAQQSEVPPSPEHASTHLLLGNMYAQMGQQEQAIAAWTQGAELFPDNAEIQAQLQAYQQQD